jgi:hypothetical protein
MVVVALGLAPWSRPRSVVVEESDLCKSADRLLVLRSRQPYVARDVVQRHTGVPLSVVRTRSSRQRGAGALFVTTSLAAGSLLLAPMPASAADGTTVRLAPSSNGYIGPIISSDGNVVVYSPGAGDPQPEGLPPSEGNHLYLLDLVGGTTERVSVTTDGAAPVGREDVSTLNYDVDGDGSRVVFDWQGGPLASTPAGGDCRGLVLRDRAGDGGRGVTSCAAPAWEGGEADGWSYSPQISDDGTRIVFLSEATNLVQGDVADVPGTVDVFVRDLPDGPTRRLSSPDLRSPGVDGKAPFPPFALSADGSTVAWLAYELDGIKQVLVVDDLVTDARTTLPGITDPFRPVLSGDGRLVSFISADSLVPGDTDEEMDGYLFDRDAPTGDALSLPAADLPVDGTPDLVVEISDDGTFALVLGSSGWEPDEVTVEPGAYVLYRRNLVTGEVDVVNVGLDGVVEADDAGGGFWTRSLSADGSRVVFVAAAGNLVAGDDEATQDAFLRAFHPPAPPGTLEEELDGSGAPLSTGAEATPELPVVLTVDPPAGLTGTLTVTPTPNDPAVPTGYSLFSAEWDTSLAISGPQASAADPYVLTLTVDQSLLAGIEPADVQVFKDGAPVADCTGAGAVPDPCVAARSAAADGDAVLAVRTTGFSTWSAGRLDYDLAGPLWPLEASPAANAGFAGLPVVVPFRLGGYRGGHVLAGSPMVASCVAHTPSTPLASGSWKVIYLPLVRSYVFTWLTPKSAAGCQDVRLALRDGSDLTVRFRLR